MALQTGPSKLLLRVIEQTMRGFDSAEVRRHVGRDLLELLGADYFASFVWHPDVQRFDDRVSINMSADNLDRYERHFQYHDPITFKLQQRRQATLVTQVMPQADLLQTEFYNDFLRRDGLYHGVNLYAYDGDVNIGDLRIWRGRRRPPFDASTLETLELIKPFFTTALKNIRAVRELLAVPPHLRSAIRWENYEALSRRYALTEREVTVAAAVIAGKTDAEIAAEACVSIATIRTHVRKLYTKLSIHRRTAVLQRLMAVAGE